MASSVQVNLKDKQQWIIDNLSSKKTQTIAAVEKILTRRSSSFKEAVLSAKNDWIC